MIKLLCLFSLLLGLGLLVLGRGWLGLLGIGSLCLGGLGGSIRLDLGGSGVLGLSRDRSVGGGSVGRWSVGDVT